MLFEFLRNLCWATRPTIVRKMSSLAPGLARKAKKILETKTEDPELLASLATLSSFYTDNSPGNRRKLRSTIERRGLEISSELLTSAESIIQSLESLESDLNGLSSACQHINTSLSTHKTSASDFLALASRLESELEVNERKGRLVGDFLKQYQLTPAEIAVLHEGEIGDVFFNTLKHVREIHGNCKGLLRTQHQRAGLELMDTMAMYQETAYERLSRWVQQRCRGLTDIDADEIDPLLKKAVQTLTERPLLYKYCAEELTSARHNALFQRFISALSRGHRPIEMHSDDPKRYINDMLAWVHQAIASEKELLESIFGDHLASNASQQQFSESERMPSVQELLDRVFESVCHQLKVRIEQVLIASPPILLCFQLSQLLGFYLGTISGMIGNEFNLVGMLNMCNLMASRAFQEQLRARGEKLLRNPPAISQDLSPPVDISEAMSLLLAIIDAHESAIETGSDASSLDVSNVVQFVVEPLVEACNLTSEALAPNAPTRLDENTSMDPSAREIFLINCLDSMYTPLVLRKSAQSVTDMLDNTIKTHILRLVDSEALLIMGKCGLGEIVLRMKEYVELGGSSVMADDPSLQLEPIVDSMRAFFLLVSEPDTVPEFKRIQSTKRRGVAVSDVGQALADSYEMVCNAVGDSKNGYGGQSVLANIKHTPAQVRTILCIS